MTEGSQASGELDILSDLTPLRTSRSRCDVQAMREERPDLAVQYDRVMAAGRYSDRDISRWFLDHDCQLAVSTVARHRRKECVLCRATSSAT